MHNDPRAIEQVLLSQQRHKLLTGLVSVLGREADRTLDVQEKASIGARLTAVQDVREDIKVAFLNLELQVQKQPDTLVTVLQDRDALKNFGFTPAQSYVLMRATQDILDDGLVSARPVALLKSALVKEITKRAPQVVLTEAELATVPVLTQQLLTVAADLPAAPVIAPVAAAAPAPSPLEKFNKALFGLRVELGAQMLETQNKGLTTKTVADGLVDAFSQLQQADDVLASVQDRAKLEAMGFTVVQAHSLARSATKFLSGEEAEFNTARVKAAVKIDLKYANLKAGLISSTGAIEPTGPINININLDEPQQGPEVEPARVSKLLKSLISTMRGALTETTAAGLEVKTQVEQSFGALLRNARSAERGKYTRLAGLLRHEHALDEVGFSRAQSDAIASSSRAYLEFPGSELNTASLGAVLRSEVTACNLQNTLTNSAQRTFMQSLRGLGERVVDGVKNSTVMQRALAGSAVAMFAGLVAVSSTVPSFLKDSAELAKADAAPVAAAAVVAAPASVAQAPIAQAPIAQAPVAQAPAVAASNVPAGPTTAIAVLNATVGTSVAGVAPVAVPAPSAVVAAATPKPFKLAAVKAETKAAAAIVVSKTATVKAPVKPAQAAKAIFNQKISEVQQQLMNMGEVYKILQKDGITGQPTQQFKNAVGYFQFSNGLEKTGTLDQPTIETLSRLTAPAVHAAL